MGSLLSYEGGDELALQVSARRADYRDRREMVSSRHFEADGPPLLGSPRPRRNLGVEEKEVASIAIRPGVVE